MGKIKTVEMDFEFSPTIQRPPSTPKQLYDRACLNDTITVDSWRDVWIKQFGENHNRFGPFIDRGIGQLFKSLSHKPCIVVGSGPSLKNNIENLKNTKGIPIISCLHNYQFMEDNGVKPDYYVTLDAGPVTIEEVSEGGSRSPEHYWETTKDKTLLAYIGTHPDLIARWKGKVYWFTAPIPAKDVMEALDKIEPFYSYVSSGGNVLGASFYIAKAIMGANPIVFVGADFSFSYTNKFHGWDSKYDANIGNVMLVTDVFGHRVKTWQSYYGFKCWIESVVCKVPGIYINATEGGILGAYPEGNIEQIKQMGLEDVITMYSLPELVADSMTTPSNRGNTVLF